MPVFRDGSSEVCVRDGNGLEVLEVPEDDIRAGGIDWDIGDGEIGDVYEAGEPDAGEVA